MTATLNNYNHLFYFYTCAQFKSFSKAAVFLKTSQPSLSIQIKTLEENLEMKLFERNGRSLDLTHDGRIIFSFCEKMFSEAKHISNYIKNKSSKVKEKISIGVSEQIERPYIADILGSLITENKKDVPLIKMQTLASGDLSSNLKMETIDIVISHEKMNVKNAEFIPLEIPVALVGQKKLLKNCQNERSKIKSFLKSYTGGLIAPIESFKLRAETDIYFSSFSEAPEIVIESGNMSANIRAIMEGVGIGFIPIIYIIKEIKNNKVIFQMPENGLWTHTIYLYYSKSSFNKLAIRQLVNLFEASLLTSQKIIHELK